MCIFPLTHGFANLAVIPTSKSSRPKLLSGSSHIPTPEFERIIEADRPVQIVRYFGFYRELIQQGKLGLQILIFAFS